MSYEMITQENIEDLTFLLELQKDNNEHIRKRIPVMIGTTALGVGGAILGVYIALKGNYYDGSFIATGSASLGAITGITIPKDIDSYGDARERIALLERDIHDARNRVN